MAKNPSKYLWHSNGKGQLHLHGTTDLPLNVIVPTVNDHPGIVVLVEGILRASFLAIRWDVTVIAAASGNFGAQAIRRYLSSLRPSRVILAPDADCLEGNTHVARTWFTTYRRIRDCGIEDCQVQFAVWDAALGKGPDDFCRNGKGLEDCTFLTEFEWYESLPAKSQRACGRVTDVPHIEWVPSPPDRLADVTYASGHRLEAWRKQIQAGNRFILDCSAPGLGKTHDAGLIQPQTLGVTRIICLTPDPRNPVTPTLSSWPILPVRHDGLAADEYGCMRRCSNGRPLIEPNCAYPKLHRTLWQKNLPPFSPQDPYSKLSHLSPCAHCPHFDECSSGSKDGSYDYLYARERALSFPRLLTHPHGLKASEIEGMGKVGLVIDDVTRLLGRRETRVTFAGLKQLEFWLAKLYSMGRNIPEELIALVRLLKKYVASKRPFGYGPHELKSVLHRRVQDWHDGSHMMRYLGSLTPQSIAIFEEELGPLRSREYYTISMLGHLLQHLAPDFLHDLVRQVRGELPMASRIEHNELVIVHPKLPLVELIAKAEVVIFLDCQMELERLRNLLPPHARGKLISVAEDAQNCPPNRRQIVGLGLLFPSFTRSDRQKDGIEKVIQYLREHHANLGILDINYQAEHGDLIQGKHFVQHVAANDFQDCDALLCIGAPVTNISAFISRYVLEYGRVPSGATVKTPNPNGGKLKILEDDNLRSHFDAEMRTYFLQVEGRLRQNARPDEELVIYFLTDYPVPLDKVTKLPIEHIDPSLARKDHIRKQNVEERNAKRSAESRRRLHQALEQLGSEGELPSVNALAKRAGCNWATASRYLKEYEQQMGSIVEPSRRKNTRELDDRTHLTGTQSYAPEERADPAEVAAFFAAHGYDSRDEQAS